MKLLNLEIFPLGENGWSSDLIEFADNITQFYGPNGTGKTPLIQSVAFCLGMPIQFRNDIYEHCKKARLTLRIGENEIYLERNYSSEFFLSSFEKKSESIKKFYNQADVSDYLLSLINLDERDLITKSKTKTKLYMSTVLPLFILDQDTGYSSIYPVQNKFIKDQFSEVVRALFGIPSKNSFDAVKDKIKAESELKFWEGEVHSRRDELKIIEDNFDRSKINKDEVVSIIDKYTFEIESVKLNAASSFEIHESFSEIINDIARDVRIIEKELYDINKKHRSVDSIINEIEDEITTLNLNEEARRAFIDFSEICPNSRCGLFSQSNEAYAKSLVYLKDQMKDLLRNKKVDQINIDKLKDKKEILIDKINSISRKRELNSVKRSDLASIELISELERKIYESKSLLSDIEKIEVYERRYFEALGKREELQSKLASFGRGNKSGKFKELVEIKSILKRNLIKWLTIIKAPNISFDISFDNDFEPIFGKEKVSSVKGSTKTRVVLAYHAALLESLIEFGHCPIPFLVFDTPKQQETDSTDLKAFFYELKDICTKNQIQVVFSTSEYRYVGDQNDTEYNPRYPGMGKDMYLSNPIYNSSNLSPF
ncbi:ATPase family protein associated with various cellular activities (AAA) [Vibrio crassostreae]|uniref:AAA family ATPase n=1 Tax=Vibrio crassostreae TaxID=246167 RepID=UPI0010D5E64A|nr:AAA family ATPase [Vibrio crassostreae]TCT43763.1 ATPase family protein associated with various cellular activities (AAA) [Vibrio crassostreae]